MSISWEGKTHDPVRYGRVGGEVVAEIVTRGTHRPSKPASDVYSVRVLGTELPQRFQYVDEAKQAASDAYEATKAG